MAELGDLAADRFLLCFAEVRLTSVQVLVHRQELGPITGELLEEVLARSGLEVEGASGDAGGAGRGQGAEQGIQGVVAVGEPRQDGQDLRSV